MKISIIVPVYNVEKYLEKCLNSLIVQTLKDLEILVINDGSTDGSQEIISQFQHKYPLLIRSFKKENGGLSDARNFGIDRARGDYIGFVDSDDHVAENMFRELYELAQKHYAEMAICNLQKVDENGNVIQKLTQIPNMPEKIILKEHFSVFSDLSYFACNKIFRKDLFENLRFTKGMHFEDIELIPQLLLRCKTIVQTQNYHYQYLERSDSISKTHTEKGLDILKAVENVENSFQRSSYKNNISVLKGFQILEGIYTYLAYLAFVKDHEIYNKMADALQKFQLSRNISTLDIIKYNRFGKNYLLSLPPKKQIFYIFYFFGGGNILRRLL